MKLLTSALCLLSAGLLSSCVDDRGHSGGYYASGGYYRSYDRDRDRDHYRSDWRNGRDWRDRDRGGYNGQRRVVLGVVQQ